MKNKRKNRTTHLSGSFNITNKLGLHARAAASFVNIASKYKSEITVTKDGISVNGKSIMGLLTLAAARGTTIKLTVSGPDANRAYEELKKLIENKFNEE